MKKYRLSLFIFRCDLRLQDNTALNEALRLSEKVIACFIFDPRQITPHAYQSSFALQFMLQSLQDLQQQFKAINAQLNIFYALPEKLIEESISKHKIEAVFMNRDYTPFSRLRDDSIYQSCQSHQIDFYYYPDKLLIEPEQVLKNDGTAYQIFTAFYNKAKSFPVTTPQVLNSTSSLITPIESQQYCFDDLIKQNPNAMQIGGREQVLKLLELHLAKLTDYENQRDFPALSATSLLSAHLKFGTCSVREVFYAIQSQLGAEHPLIRQLYWRDFFTHIAYHFPKVFGHAFNYKYESLVWDNREDWFQAWTDGKTGFPIVDAGMRELNTTGFMHNRVRMIVASFLVKDLHIDWRWGERYFAQHLIDYDPCLNNGNWQWAASTGCDAQPYFRIFNPWLQQKKFDLNCDYIYQWIPELKNFPPALIHQWDKKYCQCDYPAPMINHQLETQKTKQMFKEV